MFLKIYKKNITRHKNYFDRLKNTNERKKRCEKLRKRRRKVVGEKTNHKIQRNGSNLSKKHIIA